MFLSKLILLSFLVVFEIYNQLILIQFFYMFGKRTMYKLTFKISGVGKSQFQYKTKF